MPYLRFSHILVCNGSKTVDGLDGSDGTYFFVLFLLYFFSEDLSSNKIISLKRGLH